MEDLLNDVETTPALAKKSSRPAAALIDYGLYIVLFSICTFAFGEPVPNEEGGSTISFGAAIVVDAS